MTKFSCCTAWSSLSHTSSQPPDLQQQRDIYEEKKKSRVHKLKYIKDACKFKDHNYLFIPEPISAHLNFEQV